jgi:hypothetical protein
LRYGNTFEQFDSYGNKIDDELAFISNIQKKLLGQDKKYLTHLFAKLPKGTKKVINKNGMQELVELVRRCQQIRPILRQILQVRLLQRQSRLRV